MNQNAVKTQFAALIESGAMAPTSLHGCSEQDVGLLEAAFGQRLPQAYRDFLAIAGRGAGKLFQGTAIYFPEPLSLRQDALELLAESRRTQLLPARACVFCMHQGYTFNHFLPDGDDPAVFQYIEGDDAITQSWPSFSAYLQDAIARHLAVWPDLNADEPKA